MISIVLAWTLSCAEYHGAVERLYQDPYFQQPEYREERRSIHELFKTKTWPECLEVET